MESTLTVGQLQFRCSVALKLTREMSLMVMIKNAFSQTRSENMCLVMH